MVGFSPSLYQVTSPNIPQKNIFGSIFLYLKKSLSPSPYQVIFMHILSKEYLEVSHPISNNLS